MERSRYITNVRRTQPQRKRRIEVDGSFEDRGKYIRCWNCGFMVNTERDLGGNERMGNYSTVAEFTSQGPRSGNDYPGNPSGRGAYTTMERAGKFGPLPGSLISKTRFDVDGNFLPYYEPQLSLVSTGCPLCGTTNL